MTQLFVTGATGFLGRRVLPELLRAGHRVRCLVRSASKAVDLVARIPHDSSDRVSLALGELNDVADNPDWIDGCDGVVHMAAQLTGSPSVLFAVNVVGTRLLIRACVQHSVKRLLLVSSLSVYAAQSLPRGGLLDERCPLDPEPHLRDAYTFSKIEQERVAWAAQQAGTLPVVVLRPGVLFGPGRPLLGGRLGIRVGPLFVRMGGRRAVPYVYVDNCAEAVALAVDAPGVDGHALNIVDDNLPTANDLFSLSCRVSRVRSVMVPRWAVQPLARAYARYADRSGGQLPRVLTPYRAAAQWNTLQYPNAQAKHALGWRPSVSLAEALSRTTAAL